jgi:putative oxidoreductase
MNLIRRLIGALERVPYSLLAIPLRLAVATVFWNSGTTKLANWDATLQLFEDDYKVPLLPPDIAAHIGASIELSTPILLVLGLLTRPAALVLLGMTTVIEVFVYPLAWPTHIQWAAMLLVLLCRGAGTWSLDHWLWRRFGQRP